MNAKPLDVQRDSYCIVKSLSNFTFSLYFCCKFVLSIFFLLFSFWRVSHLPRQKDEKKERNKKISGLRRWSTHARWCNSSWSIRRNNSSSQAATSLAIAAACMIKQDMNDRCRVAKHHASLTKNKAFVPDPTFYHFLNFKIIGSANFTRLRNVNGRILRPEDCEISCRVAHHASPFAFPPNNKVIVVSQLLCRVCKDKSHIRNLW